jgi:hypothetical protein
MEAGPGTPWRHKVSNPLIVQYVGFLSKTRVREYAFAVREVPSDVLQYTVTIPNEAFETHRARYQDGPEICSLKLHRELMASGNHPLKTHFRVTDTELADFSDARKPKAQRRFQTNRKD